jgi:hypothetical protein
MSQLRRCEKAKANALCDLTSIANETLVLSVLGHATPYVNGERCYCVYRFWDRRRQTLNKADTMFANLMPKPAGKFAVCVYYGSVQPRLWLITLAQSARFSAKLYTLFCNEICCPYLQRYFIKKLKKKQFNVDFMILWWYIKLFLHCHKL